MVRIAATRAVLVLGSAALTFALIEAASSAALHHLREKATLPPELASRAFAEMAETAFTDRCHLTTEARARLAAFLGRVLAERIEARGE